MVLKCVESCLTFVQYDITWFYMQISQTCPNTGSAWARYCTGGSSWLRGRQWHYWLWNSCIHLQTNEPRTDSVMHILKCGSFVIQTTSYVSHLDEVRTKPSFLPWHQNIFNNTALTSAIDAQPLGSETAPAGYLGANPKKCRQPDKTRHCQARAVLDLSKLQIQLNIDRTKICGRKSVLQSSQPSQHRFG